MRPRVSVSMIVRNEEANLPACLRSLTDLVDEIVVVDTGSNDRTKEVAMQYGARVFDFPWVDSFAAVRNESLRCTTGEWIFAMDADNFLDEENRSRFRALVTTLPNENVAYMMKQKSVVNSAGVSATMVEHVRLFRSHPDLRWQNRIHEQILRPLQNLGTQFRSSDVLIQHTGYQNPELRIRKLERNLRLMHLENEEHPGNPYMLFQLGRTYLDLGQPATGLPILRQGLECSQSRDITQRKLHGLLAIAHHQLGQRAEALAVCQAGMPVYPDSADLLFVEGLVRLEQGDFAGAEGCLAPLVQSPPRAYVASIDPEVLGAKGLHALALAYFKQGKAAEAEMQWRAALAQRPTFTEAWLGLGELYLAQRRWAEVEQVAQQVVADPQKKVEAAVLRARGHRLRQEFVAARQILEQTIGRFPTAVAAHVSLTHVLLQEGRDWVAAEKALRTLLTLDPRNAEARHNLARLLRQEGRAAEAERL